MLYDLIIIGAGPAGVTAAIYAARKGMKFAIISPDVGGQLLKTSTVENYTGYQEILGIELAQKFEEHFAEFNFDFHRDEVRDIKINKQTFTIKSTREEFEARSVIVATGSHPRKLNVQGEKKLNAKGVTYCTTCDGPFFRGKNVAVIGGGNTALESILQLSSIAQKVYAVNLTDSFTGDDILIEKVNKLQNIEVLHEAKTQKILGESVVEGIVVEQTGENRKIDLQGVFINIGYLPQTGLVRDFVKLNDYGEIKINSKGETDLEGLFAAGDCTDVAYKQVVTSTGAGATAALSVFKYLSRLENYYTRIKKNLRKICIF